MLIRWLPRLAGYEAVWDAMKAFTASRDEQTPDEIWLVEHAPVFTQGLAGKPEHLLAAHDIPVVMSDRGGQITYHGPGQVVAYVLFDLRRGGYFVKEYVARVEQAVIDVLGEFGLEDACRKPGAPGVYVVWPRPGVARESSSATASNSESTVSLLEELSTGGTGLPSIESLQGEAALADGLELAKIAALGIKVHRGCTYHGVALNVAMDLSPFSWINPCGYAGLRTVDMASCGVSADLTVVGERLAQGLLRALQRPAGPAAGGDLAS